MKLRNFKILLLPVFCGLIVISAAESLLRFAYVGAEKCRTCHGSESIGNQYKIWQSSPHAKAVLILKKDKKARKIAAKLGIKKPYLSKKCLKCHTTGRGRVKKTMDEGVGCEACHGPGGRYHEASVHVNYLDRKAGYRKAVRYGMYPILYNLKNREKLCLYCHRKKRPCYPTDTRSQRAQRITIQVVDKLQKGNVNFRHPLRR